MGYPAISSSEPSPVITIFTDFEADFEQQCIVTLDPIAGVLAERFELLYGPQEAEETASSLVGEDAAFEPLIGEEIDIGEAVAQEFALALPPFPRSPEIRVETETESESAAAAASHPFAGLMRLVDREGGKR